MGLRPHTIIFLGASIELSTSATEKLLPDVLLLYRLHENQLTYQLNIQSLENITLRNDILENASMTIS
jgi:hypothetical protein